MDYTKPPKLFSENRNISLIPRYTCNHDQGKTDLSHHLNKLQETGLIENKTRGNYQLHQDGYNYLTAITDAYIGSQR